jgi:hypothetical protein
MNSMSGNGGAYRRLRPRDPTKSFVASGLYSTESEVRQRSKMLSEKLLFLLTIGSYHWSVGFGKLEGW